MTINKRVRMYTRQRKIDRYTIKEVRFAKLFENCNAGAPLQIKVLSERIVRVAD